MRLLFRSKYAVNRACELLEDIHDTRENAFVGSILIRGDSIIVIVGRNLLRAQDELQTARCRVHTARDRLQVGRGVDIEDVGIVLKVGLSVINRIVDVVGRVLQLIRAVRAGSLIKHIEQAVEHGLCAGIRVAAD